MDTIDVPQPLLELLESGDYILFLGAGVGVEAGVPAWGPALSMLAQRLQDIDPSHYHAGLMFQEAKERRYLEAAEILYLSPIGDPKRAEMLKSVFGQPPTITRKLKLLVSSRCHGIVTTNFDRSLELAAAQASIELVHYTEAPSDLANARVAQVPYLLRLHGRIEVPDTLVLADRHFRGLIQNPSYVEFFRNLIVNANIVFFGFSFGDPVLNTLLRQMGKAVQSVFRRKAFALLPDAPPAEVSQLLRDLAVEIVRYPSTDEHAAAWALFTMHRGSAPVIRPELYETEKLKSHLATVYARVKGKGFSADRARVLSGLMIPILIRVATVKAFAIDEFLSAVERDLALPPSLGREPLLDALKLLEKDGLVRIDGERISYRGGLASLDALDQDANRLLSGIAHRSSVRFGENLPDGLIPHVRDALVFALSLDGLHLAHSIIRGSPLDKMRLKSVIEAALTHAGIAEGDKHRVLVAALLEELMTRPDTEEERVLANVSVVVFATALLLADPTAAQIATHQLEAGAYVDASVLLPWICHGHPLQQPYATVLSAFGQGRIRVLDGYLNEVVSHRRLAIQAMGEGLQQPGHLDRYVALFELHNINTFLGGFAGAVTAGFEGTFKDYLDVHAPFDTDSAAAAFFEKKGVVIERTGAPGARSIYSQLRSELRDLGRMRSEVVIEHDARQLEVMASDKAAGVVFITADRKLIAATSRTSLAPVVQRMWLPHQAAYLAQFAGKATRGFEGIVRAMWAQSDDIATKVRRFYADRILKEYEFALTSEIPTVVAAMLVELEKSGIDVSAEVARGEGEGERLRVFTALDRFEPRFYENLVEAKKRKGIA